MEKFKSVLGKKGVVVSGLLAGLAILTVGVILTPFYNLLFPGVSGEYNNISLFRPWDDPVMSLYYFYPFILGVVLAWVWKKTEKLFEDKYDLVRAKKFALSYWIVAGLPGMFITYASFQVSFSMVLAWSISGIVDAFVAGWVFTKRSL
jgi:membrane protease YdiL (CAAX protease family)